MAKTIDKEYWVKKEVERAKYRPSTVVTEVQKAGFPKFRVQREYLDMWRAEDAKNPAKGYGVTVEGSWYWYESWISVASSYASSRERNTSDSRKVCVPDGPVLMQRGSLPAVKGLAT